jgi:hypothetical protein
MGIGAALAGISNPEQANAITRSMLASQKAPADGGTWSHMVLPNGQIMLTNNKNPGLTRLLPGNYGKAETSTGEDEAAKLAARRADDQHQTLIKRGDEARSNRSLLAEARQLVDDPVVAGYQGPVAGRMVDIYSALGTAGEDKAQRLQAIGKERELQMSSLMKGAVSDYERKLQAQASGFGITQTPESNRRALAAQERLLEMQEAKADYYQQVGGGKPIGDKWPQLEREFVKRWEAEHPLTAAAPAAAPGKPAGGNSFTGKSGKTINWSY